MLQTARILIVTAARQGLPELERILQAAKARTEQLTAGTRHAFEAALGRFAPDCVVFHVPPQGLTALQAVRLLRQQAPHAAFLYLPEKESLDYAVRLVKAGADNCVPRGGWSKLPALIAAAMRQHAAQREKEARQSEVAESLERFRRLIEHLSDGVIALDRKGQIIYLNRYAEKSLKQPKSNLLGRNIWKIFPGSVGQSFHRTYRQALRTQQPAYVEDYSAALGRWTQAAVYPSPEGLSIYFHDATARRKAESKARESEDRYRTFLERVTDGFIVLDKNFNYVYMNAKAGELIQRDPQSLIGRNVWEVFPDAVGSYTYRSFQTAMKEQRFISNLDYYEPLNLWQENYIYPSPEGLSVFIKDVTERKKLELELRDQEWKTQIGITSAAIEAQERERTHIGQELHDNVNQILVATRLYLSLVRDDPRRLSELLPQCIGNLEQAIEENRKLAHDLVAPDLQIQGLVEELSELAQSLFEARKIRFTVDASGFDESVLDGPRKLAFYRIAQEQCTNILKYARAGEVRIELRTTENYCSLTIADDGRGMDEKKTARGIGLRNIEARLNVFGGRMAITTRPGKGFRLEAELPVGD